MKKFWRCYVCNDIHYGVNPPEICSTCLQPNAYVRISSLEAARITEPENQPMDKEGFRKAIEHLASKNEFDINTDVKRVETLIEGVFNNEKNHGLKYCPCRLATKDFQEDLKIVCPCNFRIHETYQGKEEGECWCGLFKRRLP
jgi:ferredoxin-thioredoxin reductase catalytic chain